MQNVRWSHSTSKGIAADCPPFRGARIAMLFRDSFRTEYRLLPKANLVTQMYFSRSERSTSIELSAAIGPTLAVTAVACVTRSAVMVQTARRIDGLPG